MLPVMSSTDILLAEIEAFLLRTSMSAAEFGIQAVKDSAFVYRLRLGKDVRMRTADTVRAFMKERGGNGRRRSTATANAAA